MRSRTRWSTYRYGASLPAIEDSLHPAMIQATDDGLATAGSYVLISTGTGASVTTARQQAYRVLNRLTVPASSFWRNDIGSRASLGSAEAAGSRIRGGVGVLSSDQSQPHSYSHASPSVSPQPGCGHLSMSCALVFRRGNRIAHYHFTSHRIEHAILDNACHQILKLALRSKSLTAPMAIAPISVAPSIVPGCAI